MDDTKASSDMQGLDSLRRCELPRTTSPSRASQAQEEGGFTYCESLFQFPSRHSDLNESEQNAQQKQMKLYRFLETQKLEFLFDTLIDAGYDDLDQILFQMRSSLPLDLSSLASIGIRKYSHRAILLAALEQLAGVVPQKPKPSEGVSLCCGRCVSRTASLGPLEDLRAWLGEAGLEQWYDNFAEAGFTDLDKVLLLMNSTCPVTEEVLRDIIRVTNPAHRSLLLRKLSRGSLQTSQSVCRPESDSKVSACTCTLM